MEGDAPSYDRRTVFVQGVSFDLQDPEFEEAFSEIGPVRKSFLIRRKGEQKHQGAGFVQFALPADAAKAVLEYDGKILHGRKVQVKVATKRPSLAERKRKRDEDGETQTQPPDTARPVSRPSKAASVVDKGKSSRTVALGNLSAANTDEALKYAATLGEVEKIVRDVPEEVADASKLRQDGCGGNVVLLIFKSVKTALQAVTQLHGHQLVPPVKKRKGSKPAAEEPSEPLWARQLKGEGALVKKWRVILRNLPFNVKEQDLKDFLAPAGFVWGVAIPRKDNGASKGFAFASFMSCGETEKAIKLANGKSIGGRLVAVDWAVPKATFQAGQTAAAGDKDGLPTEPTFSPDEVGNDAAAEASNTGEEEAADGAENLTSEQQMMRNVVKYLSAPDDGEVDTNSDKPPPKTGKESKEQAPDKAKASKPDGAPREQQPAQAESQAAPKKQLSTHSAGDVNQTIFVRGLPNDITEQQLRARLESFGSIKACRLVMNHTTKKLKGTAFVEFEEADAARKAAEASASFRNASGPGVIVGGRPLDIDLALPADDIRKLAKQKFGDSGSKDRRNLYLAKEGLIQENSPAWIDMSRADQEKRSRASREMEAKLRSPNFFVSKTRLCLRNLPRAMGEKELKQLLIKAVKERATKAIPKLKQVKILKESAKPEVDGRSQSKGIAFAEFVDHEHALCALRQLNNNPAPFGKERRPILEFAVENAVTLKKREQREANQKGQTGGAKRERSEEEPHEAKKRAPREKRKKTSKEDVPQAVTETAPIPAPLAGPKNSRGARASGRQQEAVPARPQRPKKPQKPKKTTTEGKKAPKPASAKAGGGDALETLVANYRSSLFGEGSKKQKRTLSKRWFE